MDLAPSIFTLQPEDGFSKVLENVIQLQLSQVVTILLASPFLSEESSNTLMFSSQTLQETTQSCK
jgi:hypothetical protein